MPWIALETRIAASPEQVFDTVAHMDNYAAAIPDIVEYEFLSEQNRGQGTRFSEVRMMKGKAHKLEFEVVGYIPPDSVQIVNDSGEATWDSTFSVQAVDGGSLLRLEMDVVAKKFMLKLMLPLIKGMVRKGVAKDMQCVKEYCEAQN